MQRIILLLVAFAGAVHTTAEQLQIVTALDVDYLPTADYADAKDKLDIYMPLGATNAPVVVYFHGGGLMYGDKSLAQVVAKRLLAKGIGLVSANYRLSPGVMHPAHVQDAASATAWVHQNIAEYGGDPQYLYVGGHSAGAYLAALLALDPQHLQQHEMTLSDIRGAIPISPFLYVEETAEDRPKSIWGQVPLDWLAASVTPHIAAGKPPMLLIYADGDDSWRRAQNEQLAKELTMIGNEAVRAVKVPDRDHTSLISEIDATDDQVGELLATFIAEQMHD
ncbi:MAG: alpha/beta hydrolase fold domain-containing protein [Pseudomonadaceae bacterium]|nr:alpha/beta hydrolase fold domain-containing protein [Pseudomonadaceae bacterium]